MGSAASEFGDAEAQLLSHSNHLCPLIGHRAASLRSMDNSPTSTAQLEEKRRSGPNEAAEQALVPSPPAIETEMLIPSHSLAARLPVEVEVGIPVRGFRVRNLLALAAGVVVESEWGQGDDMPLAAGDVQLAWSEFEVIDTQLAVRLTRLV
jgi:flagellar motor switch/type III secretory pathway protein FliN